MYLATDLLRHTVHFSSWPFPSPKRLCTCLPFSFLSSHVSVVAIMSFFFFFIRDRLFCCLLLLTLIPFVLHFCLPVLTLSPFSTNLLCCGAHFYVFETATSKRASERHTSHLFECQYITEAILLNVLTLFSQVCLVSKAGKAFLSPPHPVLLLVFVFVAPCIELRVLGLWGRWRLLVVERVPP